MHDVIVLTLLTLADRRTPFFRCLERLPLSASLVGTELARQNLFPDDDYFSKISLLLVFLPLLFCHLPVLAFLLTFIPADAVSGARSRSRGREDDHGSHKIWRVGGPPELPSCHLMAPQSDLDLGGGHLQPGNPPRVQIVADFVPIR